MSQEIEIEYKSLLTEQDFTTLKQTYFTTEDLPFEQTNYYFDTPNFHLKELGMGLRIRVLDSKAELTLKSPLANQEGLLETTDTISLDTDPLARSNPMLWPEKAVANQLATHQITFSSLELKAELTTRRLEKKLSPDVLLVLDESWYHGQHDYELEMEVTETIDGYTFFTDFLKSHHISQTLGGNKIARAVHAKSLE